MKKGLASMSHRLLSAAAARLGASAAAITPPVAAAPGIPAVASEDGEAVDVVTLADAQAAVAAAEIRGATAERARTSAVMSSDAGKANPTMGAWMLENNPSADATAINAKLAELPKPETVAPPAAPAAAITTPLEQTPTVVVAPNANNAGAEAGTQQEIDALWDKGVAAASASASNNFGPPLATGVPRTGN